MWPFPSVLVPFRLIFAWRVRRTFSPSGWCFSAIPCDHGLYFLNQSINQVLVTNVLEQTRKEMRLVVARPSLAADGP